MTRLMKLGSVVSVMALSAVAVGAAAGGASRREQFQEKLGLTDTQMTQLHKLRTEQQEKAIRRRADLRVARLEMRNLLAAPTVDEQAVRAKAQQVGELLIAAARDLAEAGLALRRIVSADQAEKLLEMREHRAGAWRHHRWSHDGGDRGGDGGEADGPRS